MLVVNIVAGKEANVMPNLKATECLLANLYVVSLFKHQTSILKFVTGPLYEFSSVKDVVL